ncbi:sarcosine oxidase subunit alpha family protein [uncultured Roseibium sp.]|uniref:sarcosine oxidase subunit alpha family protein n=1 Tax=uncultured Roseibium sp. TaxID=1936171 RepID=UPI003217FC18
MSGWRAEQGGTCVDREHKLVFRFNGREYFGYEGDTLASALIANGVDVVARSFKYHRPRGVVGFGADEPNALVEVGEGPRRTPNLKATQVMLRDGLVARSQNCWPSVDFDMMAVNDLISPLIPAGFYYKTFKWPVSAWGLYEKIIRGAAGMGRAPADPDPDSYETVHHHVDVLVIGGGVSGLVAAEAAGKDGKSVMIVDDQPVFGGLGTDNLTMVEGQPFSEWRDGIVRELSACKHVLMLSRATAYGHYDGNLVAVVENVESDIGSRRWMVEAEHIVLATGALERPLLFRENDRPGVMLAGAARHFLERHGVAAGRRVVLYTNNDEAYETAFQLQAAGTEIEAVVDNRVSVSEALRNRTEKAGIRLFIAHRIERGYGRRRVSGCTICSLDGKDGAVRLSCDLILTAGGWTPTAQLFTHTGGRLRYDKRLAAMVPDHASWNGRASVGMVAAGACAGTYDLDECLTAGRAAGLGRPVPQAMTAAEVSILPSMPGKKQFVDLQNDVTTADLKLAVREGYRSVEHVKRYTTLGMGTDQGKLSGLNGVDVIAETQGLTTAQIGNSRSRPPYSPVTLGAMAGPFVGQLSSPARRSPMHDWHVAHGAVIANVGTWQRPQLYRHAEEDEFDAVVREAINVRSKVGLSDVSSLGKIDLQGPDVAKLLDYAYINGFQTLKTGRCRYGVMLREDGMVLDDGTVTRLSQDRWFMTTTTGNAERVYANLEKLRQIELPDLDVTITPVTEQWGAMAIAGPRSRDLLQALVPDFAIDNEALPFMSMGEGLLAGIQARVLRVSFSGERAYEIYVASGEALRMWEAVLEAGAGFGLMPYGTEAMMTMRIEKGLFVPGFEADGRTLPADLGLSRMVSKKKEFVGRQSLTRAAFTATDRKQLVGLLAIDPEQVIPRGAQLVVDPDAVKPVPMDGHVTSIAFSPELDRWVALALLAGGRSAHGETRVAASPVTGENVPVTICDPVFIDPEGERLRG